VQRNQTMSDSRAVALLDKQSIHRPNLVEGSTANNKYDLIELAQQIQQTDASVKSAASSKLRTILDQMRNLQNQAKVVLEEAKRDAELHHAQCNFKKIPGKLYYLYQRSSGTSYISMLSPDEWGPACPHTHLATYKLEFDYSWTPAEFIEQNEADNEMVERLIKRQFQMAIMNE